MTNNLTLNGTQLVDRAAYDYHLIPGSLAIDAGVVPGSAYGVSLTPVYQYVHPMARESRPVVSLLDVGAYECIDTDGDGMPDNWERQYFVAINSTNGVSTNEWDTDGLGNLEEYLADTHPGDSNSALKVLGISVMSGGVRVDFQGGSNAWQYLECRQDMSTNGQWIIVLTNSPPTLTNTNFLDVRGTNAMQFYRIKAERK
jgi:hypothetical protein